MWNCSSATKLPTQHGSLLHAVCYTYLSAEERSISWYLSHFVATGSLFSLFLVKMPVTERVMTRL